MITSYSRREIDSLLLAISIGTGHQEEVFSTMTRRVSSFGSMKRIN